MVEYEEVERDVGWTEYDLLLNMFILTTKD